MATRKNKKATRATAAEIESAASIIMDWGPFTREQVCFGVCGHLGQRPTKTFLTSVGRTIDRLGGEIDGIQAPLSRGFGGNANVVLNAGGPPAVVVRKIDDGELRSAIAQVRDKDSKTRPEIRAEVYAKIGVRPSSALDKRINTLIDQVT